MTWLAVFVAVVVIVACVVFVGDRLGRAQFVPGMEPGYDLAVRDRLAVCCAIGRALAAREVSWLMIEGDTDDFELSGLETRKEPPDGLSRHTIWPRDHLVAIRLRPDAIGAVCNDVLPAVVDSAMHIQMSSDGRLVFGAYDMFEDVWASDDLAELLRELHATDAIAEPIRAPEDE